VGGEGVGGSGVGGAGVGGAGVGGAGGAGGAGVGGAGVGNGVGTRQEHWPWHSSFTFRTACRWLCPWLTNHSTRAWQL